MSNSTIDNTVIKSEKNQKAQCLAMFYPLIIFGLVLTLLIFLLIYIPPTTIDILNQGNATNIFFGFYAVEMADKKFIDRHTNWMSLTLSIITILYVIYGAVFYWIYWNKRWQGYVKNTHLSGWMIVTGILVVIGIVFGFINSPRMLALPITSPIQYNFVYDCSFQFNTANNQITQSSLYLSDYGILTVVAVSTFLFLQLFITILLFMKRKS